MILYCFHHPKKAHSQRKVIPLNFFRVFIITLVLVTLKTENKNTNVHFRTLSLTEKCAIVSSGLHCVHLENREHVYLPL